MSLSHATTESKSHVLTFARFGVVGAMTAAIFFFVMWFGDTILGLRYIVFVSLAYTLSTVFHFLANRLFTFVVARGALESQIARYLIVWLINYLITILVVGLCVEKFYLSPYIGVVVSVVFTLCVGYVLGRYWIFNAKEEAE
jgi:putative flippase GtrA